MAVERMTTYRMQVEIRNMDRLALTPAELAEIQSCAPAVAPRLSASYEPRDGYCYLVAHDLHMHFVVVKSARRRLPFGFTFPLYTLMMGFEHGELWEKGPEVKKLRAIPFIFKRMLATDDWLDSEYGRKR